MNEQEKREQLYKYSMVCIDVYPNCKDCPIVEGSHWCVQYNEQTLPSDSLDDVLDEMGNAFDEAMEESKPDMVNHPPHYELGGIECIDVMQAVYGVKAVKHFCMCNAFKYLFRTNRKNGEEDVDKAMWYLTKWKELSANE